MKILTILGARPQFIKASALSRIIAQYNQSNQHEMINEVIVHSGQHFDSNMSDVFFEQLGIPKPNHHLGVSGVGHGVMTGRMLEKLESVTQMEMPDWVLVYGDTNTTLAGALVAAKLHIPLIHVEAGLRSNNLAMPEEVNRVLTDRISTVLFCPTQGAINNLKAEGYPFFCTGRELQNIHNVGDVMLDVIQHYSDEVHDKIDLSRWKVSEREYVLCTLHRAENTNDESRMRGILSALQQISKKWRVIMPLHPRTRKVIDKTIGGDFLKGLNIVDPVPYLEMQRLEMSAHTILTDSGGMQKEAFFHDVPCITLRDETEWVETVELGWNVLAGADSERILAALDSVKCPDTKADYPYGRGDAAEKIIQQILDLK
ncbi:non-hydrolyzing UDP-N-acetylglucosamine 2-epimerase [Sedimenticola selenatireducens]|uniref:non-hydrolyzing UDP-N-acetylglucosamine 2-epimerase n=1 Tax=Sedimenticola selenatireducens TaxID=191960 RepID=UPI002AAB5B85|nr:UDP-N-acetylglucosamine 2-epimerase (non-hydrolyzing) [Sedimenticola selenatireducens]